MTSPNPPLPRTSRTSNSTIRREPHDNWDLRSNNADSALTLLTREPTPAKIIKINECGYGLGLLTFSNIHWVNDRVSNERRWSYEWMNQ